MDIQRKLEIALKLLGRGVSLDMLREGSDDEICAIAKDRCFMQQNKQHELIEFADECAGRKAYQDRRLREHTAQQLQTTVLFTDDESCLTETMHRFAVMCEALADKRHYIGSRYNVVLRIRDETMAQHSTEILGAPIKATAEDFPALKEGDIVLIVRGWGVLSYRYSK